MNGKNIPVYRMNTVVIGSGAASLNCADRLHQYGQTDIAIVTEKIGGGTSNNTGSDKQTYYKLSTFGKEPDSAYEMAKSLFDGGGMHGDIALIESAGSLEGFYHLASIGVPFPHNHLGGYVGYKTDHDPRRRATSAGPWTSNQMFQCLLREVKRRAIPVFDEHDVIALIVDNGRATGVVAVDKNAVDDDTHGMVLFQAENVVFGVGGPGGIYKTSVYPKVHLGAIGLALEAGARAVNLTESQFGLSSIAFRWNVSGTYQQVVPRYISTDQNGNDEREFLNEYFPSMGKLATDVFLKGYQWPFDPRKIPNLGSSLVDVLVYIETVQKGRRVFMDFRENPRGDERVGSFAFEDLEPEAYEYLKNSEVLFGTPIERLAKMNSMAIDLYRQNGIDLHKEPLEIAVCAQHNNGGLAGDIWWESVNITHLFPIGEVNGSHGVYRPGGSALNSGQVGSLRAAQRIANVYNKETISFELFKSQAEVTAKRMMDLMDKLTDGGGESDGGAYRQEFQQRMTNAGSHIRRLDDVAKALEEAYEQIARFEKRKVGGNQELVEALADRHLAIAHAAYLDAVKVYLEAGGGSRGSYMVMDDGGLTVLDKLGDRWRYKPETSELREQLLETGIGDDGKFSSTFVPRRPVPQDDYWFENV
ncbi:MAG: FAD-binding protein, partial [Chitinivibrionales bacterium]|nr:FAD-binding protein [Chitinivibrionales bacterium]MBD3356169.1 FAD-binding protein [Chitinivibrionales bacterium]